MNLAHQRKYDKLIEEIQNVVLKKKDLTI